jgi:indolepyruvate ferredoxin oxidoreductase
MNLADLKLDDKYRLDAGRFYMTGVQALARLPMLQRDLDRRAGLATAGFVSGYRGSPLAGLDAALHDAREHLASHDVRFVPGVNEELAATACWGTQQLHLLPDPKVQGLFAMWYGKGPGVDRCVDVFKHANHAGTSRYGGVLVVAGDDHAARSSAVAHQSEHVFSACALPVLAPAGVQEIIDYGLAGWAMSRHAGLWVALKLAADVVEGSATVDVGTDRLRWHDPADFDLPSEGVHLRWPDPVAAQEHRMQAWKIYAAAAWARANGIDRVVADAPNARLGLIASGKAWLDLRQAMVEIGLTDDHARALGVRVLKVGMPWPLEAAGVRRFAAGLEEILVVEEKRQIIEYQLKEMLYERRDADRPRVLGKFDEGGEWPAPPGQWLLPPTGDLTPAIVARALASRLHRIDPEGGWPARAAALGTSTADAAAAAPARTPYFCAGCPHNRSTRVPEGSCAFGGVGCHLMAVWMERRTLTISQMGGEGAGWIGMAPHAGVQHVFANMGDGTYFHSGLLAIRAAVAAGVNVTYKILYNDAVAMTGGQPVDGPLTVPRLTRQLAAEGVARIVVLADDPHKYPRDAAFAPGAQVLARERLDDVQRELRAVAGTTVIVYDQVCATEARRRRKRDGAGTPARRVVIHEGLCEGCGDCSVKSNCLAIVPVQTEFGTKRAIDAFTCNLDLSCLDGVCPALVTVGGARPRHWQGVPVEEAGLPEPTRPDLAQPWSLLVAGVGGTGVVTIGALLGMAAHLEGNGVTVLDQTGLAQKGGAVLTHVRIARRQDDLHAPRIVHADVLLACDLLVAAGTDALARVAGGRTRSVVNTADAITGDFVRHPEREFPHEATLAALRQRLGACTEVDATRWAAVLAGHSVGANMLLLGIAWQRGLVPVGRDALLRAIELNGVAVEVNRRAFAWGRRWAVCAADVERAAGGIEHRPADELLSRSLEEAIARRRAALVAYQGERLARRFVSLVTRVRRAEQRARPGSERLTQAVTRQAHRLLAPKDVYEVARQLSDREFTAALGADFEGPVQAHFHLALPWRHGEAAPRKHRLGPWARPLLALLARGRVLRGTALDPFGRTAERRLEAQLAADYERTIDGVLPRLDERVLDAAVAVADWPEPIRGFGAVKLRSIETARSRRAAALAAFNAAAAPAGGAPPRSDGAVPEPGSAGAP